MTKRIALPLLFLGVVAVGLAGCGSSVDFVRTDPTVYEPKPNNFMVEVTEGGMLHPHVVIGVLTASQNMEASLSSLSTYDTVLAKLQKRAREVGGDALIEVRPVYDGSKVKGEVTLTAKVVRYLEKKTSITAK